MSGEIQPTQARLDQYRGIVRSDVGALKQNSLRSQAEDLLLRIHDVFTQFKRQIEAGGEGYVTLTELQDYSAGIMGKVHDHLAKLNLREASGGDKSTRLPSLSTKVLAAIELPNLVGLEVRRVLSQAQAWLDQIQTAIEAHRSGKDPFAQKDLDSTELRLDDIRARIKIFKGMMLLTVARLHIANGGVEGAVAAGKTLFEGVEKRCVQMQRDLTGIWRNFSDCVSIRVPIEAQLAYIENRLGSYNGPSGDVKELEDAQTRMLLDYERMNLKVRCQRVKELLEKMPANDAATKANLAKLDGLEKKLDDLIKNRLDMIGAQLNTIINSLRASIIEEQKVIQRATPDATESIRTAIQQRFGGHKTSLEKLLSELAKEQATVGVCDGHGRTMEQIIEQAQTSVTKSIQRLLNYLSKVTQPSASHSSGGSDKPSAPPVPPPDLSERNSAGGSDESSAAPVFPESNPVSGEVTRTTIPSAIPFAQPAASTSEHIPIARLAADSPTRKEEPFKPYTPVTPATPSLDDYEVEATEDQVVIAIACTLVALAAFALYRQRGSSALPKVPGFEIRQPGFPGLVY